MILAFQELSIAYIVYMAVRQFVVMSTSSWYCPV